LRRALSVALERKDAFMFTPVYDAVRVAEREILSARADAPVVLYRGPSVRAFTVRRVASEQLHRFAHAIAPGGVLVEPDFSPGQPTSS
jgi:hypothetical protein